MPQPLGSISAASVSLCRGARNAPGAARSPRRTTADQPPVHATADIGRGRHHPARPGTSKASRPHRIPCDRRLEPAARRDRAIWRRKEWQIAGRCRPPHPPVRPRRTGPAIQRQAIRAMPFRGSGIASKLCIGGGIGGIDDGLDAASAFGVKRGVELEHGGAEGCGFIRCRLSVQAGEGGDAVGGCHRPCLTHYLTQYRRTSPPTACRGTLPPRAPGSSPHRRGCR